MENRNIYYGTSEELLDLVYQNRELPHTDHDDEEMMDGSAQLPKLHPNPAQDMVVIGNVEKDEIERVILFDMEGRKVMEEVGSDQFEVTHLSQGAYIVALFMKNKEVHYMKLIKQ